MPPNQRFLYIIYRGWDLCLSILNHHSSFQFTYHHHHTSISSLMIFHRWQVCCRNISTRSGQLRNSGSMKVSSILLHLDMRRIRWQLLAWMEGTVYKTICYIILQFSSIDLSLISKLFSHDVTAFTDASLTPLTEEKCCSWSATIS